MGRAMTTYLTLIPTDPSAERTVALMVCSVARSTTDARDLMDALGLLRSETNTNNPR